MDIEETSSKKTKQGILSRLDLNVSCSATYPGGISVRKLTPLELEI